ncbi:MAG: hypothetical protein V4727_04345 [Verrucomicrobiota bacterium]
MLMILLVIIALGSLSLSTVNLRNSSHQSARAVAEANARMALMIAVGELQKAMGPDQRVSARALTLSQDNRIGTTLMPNDPKAWWVGVAGTNSAFGLNAANAVSPSNPAAVWLVSGLDRSASVASQLAQPFDNPVDMFGEYSIDLSMTGGQPLTAGIVKISGENGNHTGGYAYFVDDDGMKAQLAPSNVELVNTGTPVRESDLTPGAYDVSELDGMSALVNNSLSNYSKILSTGDLALLEGGGRNLAASKRLGYTTYSRGVLCDVKNGGLKRDLTAAFENDATFNTVFPLGNTADYLLIEQAKLATCSDLQVNGYIHWDVFKDYYNIKKYIKTHTDGSKYLDPVRYTKAGVYTWNNGGAPPGWAVNPVGEPSGSSQGSLLMAGRLGPHNMGDNSATQYPETRGLPYGDYRVYDPSPNVITNHGEFKHSPVMPILQRMQANAWIEYLDQRTLRTHAQMWSSHYNPYNIQLFMKGSTGGPRILGTPQITAYMMPRLLFKRKRADGTIDPQLTYLDREMFTSNKAQFQSKSSVMMLPGRSHVMAYESSAHVDNSADGFLYNDRVKDLTVESVYRDLVCEQDLPANITSLDIRFELQNTSLHQGIDDTMSGGGNVEMCQSLWAPFAWDKINNSRPGKLYKLGSVATATLNENRMSSLNLNLRTTREPGSTIRPLVDANIRCMFGNARWDSPLNLPALAAYSTENQGNADEMIMQMSTVDQPKGYSYWGAGRDPSYGFDRVILFDIPRSDLVSLGQLQHAGAGRFSYEPTYVAGNSYANLRIPQANWKESITDTFSTDARGLADFRINGSFNLYDASYLVNEVLWDRYTFTTIPQVADNITSLSEPTPNDTHFTALAKGQTPLPNARYLPYEPVGSKFNKATLQMISNKTNGTGAFYHNAGHLLVDGAFNVNSTSVDAWEAFLSSTHSLPVAKVNMNGVVTGFDAAVNMVRYPRVQSAFGDGVEKGDLDEEGCWTGFRKLEQSEVRTLAQAVVDEVKKRGPFLSMGDFVNRKLVSGELGASGALQAALDKTINSGIDSDVALNNQGAGVPGLLLQGDVLQALAPRMTVRSDVFTIRAYGESVDAKTGKVLAKAWCEAKVQRFPDPVLASNASSGTLKELSNPTSPFGRQFRMISFRWLNANEI